LARSADEPQLKALLAPYPSDETICWPIIARVGNVKSNDPGAAGPMGTMAMALEPLQPSLFSSIGLSPLTLRKSSGSVISNWQRGDIMIGAYKALCRIVRFLENQRT
jgi:hypothetical protein